jgi:RNA-directed DNA polymerase
LLLAERRRREGALGRSTARRSKNDLDKELERRGHRFCRYADDCNIYVRSRAAGERVMASVASFLEKRLRYPRSTGRKAPLPKPRNGSSLATG